MAKTTTKVKSKTTNNEAQLEPISPRVFRDGKIKSALEGKEGQFKVFYDKEKNSSKGKVLVVRAQDRDAIREATKRLGKPTASATLRNGIVELGGVNIMRCFG